jgi:hypothetical protein
VRGVAFRKGRWVVAAECQWGDFQVAAQLAYATSSGSSNPGCPCEAGASFRALEMSQRDKRSIYGRASIELLRARMLPIETNEGAKLIRPQLMTFRHQRKRFRYLNSI